MGLVMLEGIDESAVTPREKGYIDALRRFYLDYPTLSHQTRARAYRDRMSQLYMDNLDDPEAAVVVRVAKHAQMSERIVAEVLGIAKIDTLDQRFASREPERRGEVVLEAR